ncbi:MULTISPECIES: anti-sigma factor [unclassified Thalassospira]|uniref:anti-sigma factor n=1 Tax=unclassified Thalassospira TaxID=2648997 RepID=UPI002600C801|nr:MULTISPECIES: anti-sigma factor [unclassified Thalassospira]|tara:strand:- start:135 stop:887 length:753 start_codon:yes stop_codon:yes gene_type:complete
MTDRDDIDMLAAEYVLGTLDPAQRQSVEKRRSQEPELDRAISDWEARLSPLNAHYDPVAPTRDLFAGIRARIEGTAQAATQAASQAASQQAPGIVEFAKLKRKLAIWRAGALGAAAIATSMVVVLLSNDVNLPVENGQFVAVFHRDDTQPAFVMSVDLETREVTIRPVEATMPEGKTYQLWIVTEETGPKPKSLGLLENIANPTTKQLGGFDPAMLRNATFGISLEPEGGSPTGQPTGPAIHGRLISVAQ